MDYIENMQSMLSDGYTMNEVAENLYLNYHSVINIDEVYQLRKAIATKYDCNLNDVKLIGSSHTGYTYKDGKLLKRENPKDYDFAIINADVYIRFFHMIDIEKISGKGKRLYTNGILHGKLHPLHAGKRFLEKLEKMNKEIMEETGVSKHVSICFYLSEKDFIDGLVKYDSELYAGELRRISEQKDRISDLENLSDMKIVDKLEE